MGRVGKTLLLSRSESSLKAGWKGGRPAVRLKTEPSKLVRSPKTISVGEIKIQAQTCRRSDVLFTCGNEGGGARIQKHRGAYVCC